jgi:hypothetical protein
VKALALATMLLIAPAAAPAQADETLMDITTIVWPSRNIRGDGREQDRCFQIDIDDAQNALQFTAQVVPGPSDETNTNGVRWGPLQMSVFTIGVTYFGGTIETFPITIDGLASGRLCYNAYVFDPSFPERHTVAEFYARRQYVHITIRTVPR